jgi:hypothetical protein
VPLHSLDVRESLESSAWRWVVERLTWSLLLLTYIRFSRLRDCCGRKMLEILYGIGMESQVSRLCSETIDSIKFDVMAAILLRTFCVEIRVK